MSMTRLKIIDEDSVELAEEMANRFLESDEVYSVIHIAVYPKSKDRPKDKGCYCYITYKAKFEYDKRD